jgi:hypothetical protein
MGALIMLLVLIARDVHEPELAQKQHSLNIKSTTDSTTDSTSKSTTDSTPNSTTDTDSDNKPQPTLISATEINEKLESIKLDTNEIEWLTKQFAESKLELEKNLANEEAYLASVEKQTVQLREEIKRLLELAKNLKDDKNQQNKIDSKTLEQLLKQKNDELAKSEQHLNDLQTKAKNKKKSYAIIPYRGTNGTFRKPIYIECKNNKVIIQPEGIELTTYDFLALDRADNPFDSLLRVVRQYYAETNQIDRDSEPYPLIIIRPSGVQAFEAAYAAMGNWLKDFGYELVAEDWNIEYPNQNDELKIRMEKQLVISRQRLQSYIAVMQLKNNPNNQNYPKNIYPNNANNQDELNRVRESSNDVNQNNSNERNIVTKNNDQTRIGEGNGKREFIVTNGIAQEIGGGTNSIARLDGINPNSHQNEIAGSQNNNTNFNGKNIIDPKNPNYPAAVNSTPNISIADNYNSDNHFSNSLNSNSASTGTQNNPLLGTTIKTLPTTNGSTSPPNSTTNSTINSTANSTTSSTVNSTNSNSNAGENSFQSPSSSPPNLSSGNQPSIPRDLPSGASESTIGIGHPNPESASTSTLDGIGVRSTSTFKSPVRRNIKIQIGTDRFIIVKQTGFDIPRTIMIESSAKQSVSNLLNAIGDFVETWGIAGEKFYWQPVLKVKILNGAEPQFNELQRLLKENAIDIVIEQE